MISFLLSLLYVAKIAAFLRAGRDNEADMLGLGISFAAALMFIWLSVVEHRHSPRPSAMIAIYLLLMTFEDVLLNGATIMSLVHRYQFADVSVAAGETLGRVLLLVLESHAKPNQGVSSEKPCSPEDNASIFGRVFLWWLKDLLLAGKQRILQINDTPMLSSDLQPRRTRKSILRAWNQRGKSVEFSTENEPGTLMLTHGGADKPETSLSLLRVLAKCLTRQLLSPVIPRLCVIAFRCSQPVLISRAILLVRESQGADIDKCNAYRLFVAAVVVYLGLAVSERFWDRAVAVTSDDMPQISSSIYKQQMNKLEVLIRTSLINLVYEKALHMNEGSDAGRVVTIIGTDIEGLGEMGALLHGTWAQAVELIIGMVLLAREVGWLFPVPLVTVFCESLGQKPTTPGNGILTHPKSVRASAALLL